MIHGLTLTLMASTPGSTPVHSANAPSTSATIAAHGEEPVAGHHHLECQQPDADQDQQQPADVERQRIRANERQHDGDRAEDSGEEVRVEQLGDDAVEADGEQHERDVRIAQQVEELLAWIHLEVARSRDRSACGSGSPLKW